MYSGQPIKEVHSLAKQRRHTGSALAGTYLHYVLLASAPGLAFPLPSLLQASTAALTEVALGQHINTTEVYVGSSDSGLSIASDRT